MSQLTGHTDSVLALDAAAVRSTGLARLHDFKELSKPRITGMVVITAYVGYAMAVSDAGVGWNWLTFAATLWGVALSCMGASAFNQVFERDTDALMHRTKDRPMPAGRIGVGEGLAFAVGLSLLGVAMLATLAHPLAAAFAAFTIVSYALVYTPLKRVSNINTLIGAVPGAMPPVIGYAAVSGRLGPAAVILFAIMFLWQLPHFLAIAWLYREDYGRAGLKMLPVVEPDGHSTFRQIMIGCMALLPLGLMPTVMGVSGMWYFMVALLSGAAFLALGVVLVIGRRRRHARALFFASLVYLPAVLLLMMIDRV